jgi:hypothetical protein
MEENEPNGYLESLTSHLLIASTRFMEIYCVLIAPQILNLRAKSDIYPTLHSIQAIIELLVDCVVLMLDLIDGMIST